MGLRRNGLEADRARFECAAGDFGSPEEAVSHFNKKYDPSEKANDILFLLNDPGEAVGSCIAWTDLRQGSAVSSVHWRIVEERYQGNRFGRALCCAAMETLKGVLSAEQYQLLKLASDDQRTRMYFFKGGISPCARNATSAFCALSLLF